MRSKGGEPKDWAAGTASESGKEYKAHDPISIALVEQSNQVLEYELLRQGCFYEEQRK